MLLFSPKKFTFIGLPFYRVFAPHFALIYTQNSENSAQPLTRFLYDVFSIKEIRGRVPSFLHDKHEKHLKMRSFRLGHGDLLLLHS